ncbi:Disease resistance protein RPM1 [Hordeum vulgare]|nr:Disease resistance protein RPM1 [Hordeum vulgare]
MLTTREARVAAHASGGRILTMGALPEDKAWDLFCKKAFPKDTNHQCPIELKPSSMEIVSKCKGLPLAIVSVGSMLRVREKTVEEWRRINDQLGWEIINNSRLDHIRNVLHLSFIYLPTFTLLPLLCNESRYMTVLELSGLPIEKIPYAIGDLFNLRHLGLRGTKVKKLPKSVEKLSNLLTLDLCRSDIHQLPSVDLCQKNCFGVIYEEKCGGAHQKDGRRLVLHKLKDDIQQPFSNMHQLRTMITLGDSKSSFTLLPLLCNESRHMTVLELSGLPIEKIPDAIGGLVNLRHLGLRNSKVKTLPKSVEKLSNLLTLDLFGSDIHELPCGIVKLKMLRHLFAERVLHPDGRVLKSCSGMCIPNGLGNLTNLQTLQSLAAQDQSLRHLGELTQLRSLRLWNVKGIYCGLISESLVHMQYLSYLDVNASDENEVLLLNACLPRLQKLSLRGRLAEGALDECPIFQAGGGKNLYELSLFWSQLREDPLPSLSLLSNLTRLEFSKAYNGEQLTFLAGWFPMLKILFLRDLPNVSRLEIAQGAMASLEKLFLVNLSSMTEVPHGIEFLLPLQYLTFREITNDLFTSLCQCSAIQGKWRSPVGRKEGRKEDALVICLTYSPGFLVQLHMSTVCCNTVCYYGSNTVSCAAPMPPLPLHCMGSTPSCPPLSHDDLAVKDDQTMGGLLQGPAAMARRGAGGDAPVVQHGGAAAMSCGHEASARSG